MGNYLWTVPAYHPFVGGAQVFVRRMVERQVGEGNRVSVVTTNARQADDFWRPSTEDPPVRLEMLDGAEVERLALTYPWPAPFRFAVLRRLGHWCHRSGLPLRVQRALLRRFARSMPAVTGLESVQRRIERGLDALFVVDASWDGLFTRAIDSGVEAGVPVVAVPLVHRGSRAIVDGFTMAHQVASYRRADALVALSAGEETLLAGLGSRGEGRLQRLSLGADRPGREPGQDEIDRFVREQRLTRPMLAFVGAATYDKGALTLVDAVLSLSKRYPELTALFVGPEQQRVRAYLAAKPVPEQKVLETHLRLLGIVEDGIKDLVLSQSTLLVLPSRVDSFGIVLVEAALHGKPVIAAAAGGLTETVVDGETGLLVPFGDVEKLVQAIDLVIGDPVTARRLGEAGRQRAEADYSWDHTYGQLRGIHRAATALRRG